ncbi:MAG: 3-deoxy-7-phosphoheptulonate synthase [Oscillospiraceae bacterium]|nr:3-deoxy-7-phosphoheptulonate synthase [Oscillospiraceae bacterium]
MSLEFERKLTIPAETKKMYPRTSEMAEIFNRRDAEIKDIFSGKSDKLLLIIGPCSADHQDSVLDYMNRLRKVAEEVKDEIFIVPRVYTNKPRTTGMGYKGMLHQPDPNAKPDMFKGLIAIRELHMRVIAETGFTCADEMLYSENYRYLDDVLAYVAIGARSVENQQHRLTSSGIDVPVGMKNPTSGDFSVMMNAITAAQNSHTFIYRGWEVHSSGNPYAHSILRGYVDKRGQSHPNYHYEDLLLVNEMYQKHPDLVNPAIVVDCNHSNSNKQYAEQPRIAKEIIHNRRVNNDIKKLVKGLMVESYIEDGSQPVDGGVYGKSITDACIGWDKTQRLIYDLAEEL